MEIERSFDTVTIEFSGTGERTPLSFKLADDWETLRDLTLAVPKVREAVLKAMADGNVNAVVGWYESFIDTAMGEGATKQIIGEADAGTSVVMLGPVVEYLCDRITEQWKNAFAD